MVRWVGLFLLLLLVGCGKKASGDKIIDVRADDPKMNAAMDQARASVNTFTEALQSPKPGQAGFSVKVGFKDEDKTEYMWLTPVTFDGKVFHGVVNNQPEKISNVTMGENVSVEPSRISDWMFVENRKLVGGTPSVFCGMACHRASEQNLTRASHLLLIDVTIVWPSARVCNAAVRDRCRGDRHRRNRALSLRENLRRWLVADHSPCAFGSQSSDQGRQSGGIR